MTTLSDEWDLLKDGFLWKAVLAGFGEDSELENAAKNFVARLQQNANRHDPLQFVLLDRRASNFLRQLMILEFEASQRKLQISGLTERVSGSPERDVALKARNIPKGDVVDTILHYQLVLDRQDQHDAILLQRQQLLGLHERTQLRKPAQSTSTSRGSIEKSKALKKIKDA